MATNENGTSDASEQLDLDRLIGELETEAARRRAAPDYPHDADAQLHFELARRAPNPPRADALRAIIAQLEEIVSVDTTAETDARSLGSRRHDRQILLERLRRLEQQVASLGLAAVATFHALADRVEQLEAHDRLARPHDENRHSPRGSDDEGDALAHWRTHLADTLPRHERVLYAEAQVEAVVIELRAAGVDAYGVTDDGAGDLPGPDVRGGDLLTHLRAVADDALAAVVLAGRPVMLTPDALGPLVRELGRVTSSAVLVSEAPWWWRLRVGAVNADLSQGHPLDPDTWLHAFHGVGMVGTAHYDPTGQSYQVTVRVPQ